MQFKYPLGATPLDADELRSLIPRQVTTQVQLNAWEEENIFRARQWSAQQKNIISIDFIQKLHHKMFDQTWRWAGKFRTSEKNIGVHWAQISTKLQILCENTKYQIEHAVYAADEIAVRFHHGLVLIHAFSNGNGRHARLMADLLIKQLGKPSFSWGQGQNLTDQSLVRSAYIQALQAADAGDFTALLAFARS